MAREDNRLNFAEYKTPQCMRRFFIVEASDVATETILFRT